MEEKRLRKLAGLNEALGSDPFDARDELSGQLEKLSREMEDLELGPALDTREPGFDKPGVRKILSLLKKVERQLKEVQKNIDTINNLGL
jgi:methyl coenzyme M reductase gamma subunit